MADLQRATSHQMQLPGVILARQRVDAAQRASMEHRGGNRKAFKQNGKTVDHDGTLGKVERDQGDTSYRNHPLADVINSGSGRPQPALPAAVQRAQHFAGIYARGHSRME